VSVPAGLFWLWNKKKQLQNVNKAAGAIEHTQVAPEL
jgi:hypothetical protein